MAADIRIDGRARLVGVSCKCEIGKVTARGAGIAKIPGVSASTVIGEVCRRGDRMLSVPAKPLDTKPLCG